MSCPGLCFASEYIPFQSYSTINWCLSLTQLGGFPAVVRSLPVCRTDTLSFSCSSKPAFDLGNMRKFPRGDSFPSRIPIVRHSYLSLSAANHRLFRAVAGLSALFCFPILKATSSSSSGEESLFFSAERSARPLALVIRLASRLIYWFLDSRTQPVVHFSPPFNCSPFGQFLFYCDSSPCFVNFFCIPAKCRMMGCRGCNPLVSRELVQTSELVFYPNAPMSSLVMMVVGTIPNAEF